MMLSDHSLHLISFLCQRLNLRAVFVQGEIQLAIRVNTHHICRCLNTNYGCIYQRSTDMGFSIADADV